MLQLLHKAGYLQPTQLQELVIPLILKGRDIAIEAGEKTGKTAAFILPVLERIYKNKAGIKALVITATFENAKKISREFHKFIKYLPSPVLLALLGNVNTEKEEFRTLSRKPDIVIGSAERVIDHIRRGNLSFEILQFFIIDGSDMNKNQGFDPDIHFISSKLNTKHQIILFYPSPIASADSLLSLLKRPVMIHKGDWIDKPVYPGYSYFNLNPEQIVEKKRLLARLVITKKISSLLLLCHNPKLIPELKKFLKRTGLSIKTLPHKVSEEIKQNVLKSFNAHRINVLIATVDIIMNQKYMWPSHIIYFDLPENQKQYVHIPAQLQSAREVILFIDDNFFHELQKYEEIKKLDMKKDVFPTDESVLKSFAETIIKKIKEDENPEELNMYKKLVKKNVPLLFRTYVLAYLFKEELDKKIHKQRSSTTTLFISVGKNKRVFPPDLLNLFVNALKIKRSEIKDIKILDNYSFLEISSRYASRAISLLNGKDFKGKKMSVNYARKKRKEGKKP
ncbi:MAG: DEAD/DEAH box helicase [Spirochaetales bacterium]|nr:DEAD/DEAH box helicase [Spirochaetales bacterium]